MRTCVVVTLDVIAMEKKGETITAIGRMIYAKWSKVGPDTCMKRP